MAAYLEMDTVFAVDGTWLAPAADIRAGNWAAISERVRTALAVSPR